MRPEKKENNILAIFKRKLSLENGFRARFFLEAPFAEVLSGLLWTAYWPLVFLFSPFFGVVLARSFFPHFSIMDSKTVQRSFRLWIPKRCPVNGAQFSIMDSKTVQRSALCGSRRELSNEYLLAKFGFDTGDQGGHFRATIFRACSAPTLEARSRLYRTYTHAPCIKHHAPVHTHTRDTTSHTHTRAHITHSHAQAEQL